METAGQGTRASTGSHLQWDGGGGDGVLRIRLHGSSDDGRERQITTDISPYYAKQILELQEAGETEEDLHPIVAEAITESYFTEWGTRVSPDWQICEISENQSALPVGPVCSAMYGASCVGMSANGHSVRPPGFRG
ncbi:hypothetical protein ABZS79_29700 [Streptomyces griseoloalbus]